MLVCSVLLVHSLPLSEGSMLLLELIEMLTGCCRQCYPMGEKSANLVTLVIAARCIATFLRWLDNYYNDSAIFLNCKIQDITALGLNAESLTLNCNYHSAQKKYWNITSSLVLYEFRVDIIVVHVFNDHPFICYRTEQINCSGTLLLSLSLSTEM